VPGYAGLACFTDPTKEKTPSRAEPQSESNFQDIDSVLLMLNNYFNTSE
jgi:hypothetical protein